MMEVYRVDVHETLHVAAGFAEQVQGVVEKYLLKVNSQEHIIRQKPQPNEMICTKAAPTKLEALLLCAEAVKKST